jgi:protein-tyrosine kinase
VTKIYEALRRHEQQPMPENRREQQPPPESRHEQQPTPENWREQRPTLEPAPLPPSQLINDLLFANRDMQTLYRSVEALIAGKQGGSVIMFSSAHSGEGKTTVCGSFAATLAQNFGKSVLILDGDRNHALTGRFEPQGGATTLSLGKSAEAVLQASTRVGSRGSITAVPITSLLGLANADSPELDLLASIKGKLAATFNYILIDAPSLADVSWSPSIGPFADGVILVVEAERTRWPVAKNAMQEFENSGAKVLGVFLNKRHFYITPRIYRYL